MTEIEILKSCFYSPSNLWQNFTIEGGKLNVLFYPSAGEDMRPFVFSKKENLNFIGLKNGTNYFEPNFFIFSDYFPFPKSRFFDSRWLHWDNYTEIYIEDYCEIFPTDLYEYRFNKKHVHFETSLATGKAIFFRARISSHKIEKPYFKHGIYFFYENVNLIEQLFLKNKMTFSHLVWKRDGSGLGGGGVKLDFIFNISFQCQTSFYFLWDHYLDEEYSIQTNNSYNTDTSPSELRNYINGNFKICLKKELKLRWNKYDIMNLYIKI